jgi:non-ribosomal peptide synthetase component F
MAYLEHALRTMSPSQFGEPRYPDEGTRMIRYRSPATALAIRRVAAQEATSTSSVLLAAFAVSLARFTGNDTVMAMLLVSNRFRPGFADSVSPVVETCPYLVDVGGVSLRDAVGRTNASVFNAYKNAYYDPYEQDAVLARVEADRGPLDYTYRYNDRRRDRTAASGPLANDDEIRAAVALAEYAHGEVTPGRATHRFDLTVADVPDAVEFEMTADARFLTAEDMVRITAEFEQVAVLIATAPTLPTDFSTNSPYTANHSREEGGDPMAIPTKAPTKTA